MSSKITNEELSGPEIDRRTALQIFGVGGAMSALSGCMGGGGQQKQTKSEQTNTTTTSPGEEQPKKVGGRLDAGWFVGEITNLDPVLNSVVAMEQASMNIFNALLRTTPDFRIVGDAAKDWTVKDDTTYVFELREGMQFQKGYGEVTAQDVKYTIRRGKNAKGSTVKPKLKRIKPVDKGGVRALDTYTVEINLTEPFVPMLKALTRSGGAAQIQPKEAVQKLGRKYKVTPVGSGPFEVKSHKVGSQLVLSAHDGYWRTNEEGTRLPYLDEVKIKPIPEAATMVNALRAGDISFANTVSLQNLRTIRQGENVKAYRAPAGGWNGLIFNTDREPFGSAKVRRGIAKLIDSEKYVKRTFFGNNDDAIGPIGPAHGPFYRKEKNKPDYQKYDPQKGKQLLREAGAMGASWNILINQRDIRQARVMKQELSDYFDITINAVGTSTFWTRFLNKRDFDTAVTGSDIDISVDTTLYFFFKSPNKGGVYNQSGYSNKKVDRLLNQQRRTFDDKERQNMIQTIEDLVMRDAPVAFAYHVVPWQVHTGDVQNYRPHPFMRDLAPVWVKE